MGSSDIMENDIISLFLNRKKQNISRYTEVLAQYTLNNSKYILVELPFHNQIVNLEDIIYELKVKGFIPIIAHPERYSYFQKNYKEVDRLKEEGFLFQANYSSVLGYYGKDAKKLVKYMFKKRYIDYLGTDVHKNAKTYVIDNFAKIEKHIIRLTKKDYYDKILNNNNSILKEVE